MKKALLIPGGWDGHQPEAVVQLLAEELKKHGIQPEIESSLDCLADEARLKTFSLIVPCWTMGALTPEQGKGLHEAVAGGVGLGGAHGGMGDAFRGELGYEWMVGGHFVGHPYVGEYTVKVKDFANPITATLPGSFTYNSEQYYMMVDPGIHVLADTEYTHEGRTVTMPVAWIKKWGQGRVFYSALGHEPAEFTKYPEALELTVRGLRWAAGDL